MSGVPCVFCDGQRAATVLMTWLDNGATIAACGEDLAPAMVNVLAVELGADPTRFYTAVQKFLAAEAKRQAKEAEKGTPDAAAIEPAAGPGEPTPHDDGQVDEAEAEREETGIFHGFGEEAQ